MSIDEDALGREARAAKNQSLFREINERVRELNDGLGIVLPLGEWVCECANNTCTKRVELTTDEYEAIRADGACFFIAPSDEHFLPDVERVVQRTDRYWIVQKFGYTGTLARQTDPRSGDGPLPLNT